MAYKSINKICGELWIGTIQDSTLFDMGYKDEVFLINACIFSLFEEKILAVKKNNTVYIYLFDKNGTNFENALTLLRILSRNDTYERALIIIDEILYEIDFKCTILCHGRK